MTVRAYPAYRESEIEWIGPLPIHWDVSPLARLASEVEQPNLDLQERNRLSLSYGRIIERDINSADGLLPESFNTYNIIKTGDIVLRLTDLQNDKRSLRTAISMFHGIISSAYTSIRPHGVEASYLAYLLHSYDITKVFYGMGGGLRQTLKFFDMKYLPIIVPDSKEQSAIVTFLDRETGKIDVLTAEQERLIALLKEKRQAVISHAVTKGLDLNAPMKDSGVPWLGQVPSHWVVGRCGYYFNVLPGFAFPSGGFSQDDKDVRLLRGANVGVAEICWDDVVYWRRTSDDDLDIYELVEGDLVLGMDRPWISAGVRVAKLTASDVPSLLLQRTARISARSHVSTDLLERMLSSNFFISHFGPEMTGVSVPHISPDQINDFKMPIPPESEQADIVAYIKDVGQQLHELMKEAKRAIALLSERRAALISAAVTGKIDVRDTEPAIQAAA